MRYLTIPSPITLVKPNDGSPILAKDGKTPLPAITFDTFVFNYFLNRQGFAVGYRGAKMVEHIEDVILPAKAGELIGLDESVWKHLVDIIDNQLTIEPAWVHRQYLPFMEAIKQAPDKKPKE